MKVLSLFDGISCGMVALERAGIQVDRYVAYEIDSYAIQISKKNYPQIEHCGDVTTTDFRQYEGFDILIGGSPCTHWSIANKNRETKAEGIGFELFMCFVKALEESKCKYFLYENNNSISKEIKQEITDKLGVEPIMINSSLVSAQERKRCYWTNIPDIQQPERKAIYLKDVLGIETNEMPQDRIIMSKADFDVKVRKHYINQMELASFLKDKKKQSGLSTKEIAEKCGVPLTKAEHWFRTDKSFAIPDENVWWLLKEVLGIDVDVYDKPITEFEIKKNNYDMAKRIYNINGKHPTLTTLSGGHQRKTITDGSELFYLEPTHCEQLQTLPVNYTEGISDRQRFKCIGNGWTVDVIAHILSYLPDEYKKEKEIKQMELRVNDYQLPEAITFNYEELKQELTEKVSMYTNLVYTDEQIKEAKADKANLNKLKKALNDERIRLEREYMQPFNDTKAKFNEIIGIIDKPVALIDAQVKGYEEKQKQDKLEKIKAFFEKCNFHDFKFEQIYDPKWLNASVSMKSIEETICAKGEQIANDLATLQNLPEFGFEATEVYKSTLDINRALNEGKRLSEIAKAKAVHEAEMKAKAEEQARLAEEASKARIVKPEEQVATNINDPNDIENIAPIKPVEAPAKQWVKFQAFMTVEQAKELKQFFDDRQIEFKAV